ncbi:Arginyl-tRNA--protein transferase 1 [Hypsibius exemplaris]|uniref:Arginyl-tRNA--protein transferase 1 n=1 Tax=Hypsibius exemplaris TaxID=2072580 RepID=A0A9X6NH21_HYPEX|nr:Arginyl-tRNA--protein transferase 1 [Hypsibius exemplaris]
MGGSSMEWVGQTLEVIPDFTKSSSRSLLSRPKVKASEEKHEDSSSIFVWIGNFFHALAGRLRGVTEFCDCETRRRSQEKIMAHNPKYSLVELFESSGSGSRCGYCGGEGSISDGMWGYRLTVNDYMNLLQRGWRRSGKYIYKPIMKKTCCPQYAIRCEALRFQLTRSQKKVIKRVYRYLAFGVGDEKIAAKVSSSRAAANFNCDGSDTDDDADMMDTGDAFMNVDEPKMQPDLPAFDEDSFHHKLHGSEETDVSESESMSLRPATAAKAPRPGVGPIPDAPLQRKKKEIRRERKRQKLLRKGLDPDVEELKRKLALAPPSLEDCLGKPLPENPKHTLVTRLVMPGDRDPYFMESFEETLKLYQKYELTIHKKEAERPTEKQFTRFLAESPLQYQSAAGQSPMDPPTLGSFHLHYILDGKLVGVDVLDVLPDCVTSVYFFYDPDYSYLSLGTYSVLKEIEMIRALNKKYPEIQHASLGFYVHSCPKMQYKAKFQPSYLLCPEVFTWHPLNACLEKLNKSAYHRLGLPQAVDHDGDMDSYLNEALVLYKRNLMTFDVYKLTLLKTRRPYPLDMAAEINRIAHYGRLVGRRCLPQMALYCDNAPLNRET